MSHNLIPISGLARLYSRQLALHCFVSLVQQGKKHQWNFRIDRLTTLSTSRHSAYQGGIYIISADNAQIEVPHFPFLTDDSNIKAAKLAKERP